MSEELRPRPRQNVVLEWGFFIGKLGRRSVCALFTDDVEIPSDYSGVVYIPMDDAGAGRCNYSENSTLRAYPWTQTNCSESFCLNQDVQDVKIPRITIRLNPPQILILTSPVPAHICMRILQDALILERILNILIKILIQTMKASSTTIPPNPDSDNDPRPTHLLRHRLCHESPQHPRQRISGSHLPAMSNNRNGPSRPRLRQRSGPAHLLRGHRSRHPPRRLHRR